MHSLKSQFAKRFGISMQEGFENRSCLLFGSLCLCGYRNVDFEDSVSYWAYFVNWELFLQGHYLPGTHFWSLAVEEQFYLLWPLIVFCASRRFPLLLYSGFIFSGFVFFAWPAFSMNQLPFGWTCLPTSAFSALGAGALLRHVYHRLTLKSWNGFFVLGAVVFIGVHSIPTALFYNPAF